MSTTASHTSQKDFSTQFADPALFRQSWRGLGSTVTLVSTQNRGKRFTMLATAVNSVSMDPPSLLVCVNKSATAHVEIAERKAFSVGLLRSDNRELSSKIGAAKSEERFGFGTWSDYEGKISDIRGIPWLAEAQSTLFCTTDQSFDYGTHTIFIGLVRMIEGAMPYDPLLYCDGKYGKIGWM
ncbi:flavin reductase family protein [Brucella sp. NBRC 12950]|uniref:flavin reductase family protein n=1 Tax=Brucella sp. NBRC 12950 TaxID=2994518 RepID=UPI0024A14096|nr:flavin reductase family protein [Brucella sp. NBRC 12950]GLU30008.1 flavin oxidoreductase [Brucella sp. NBRC 12950]